MFAATINRNDDPPQVSDDPLCFHLWKCHPAAYFEYLASPGTLSAMLGKPDPAACSAEAAIAAIADEASVGKR